MTSNLKFHDFMISSSVLDMALLNMEDVHLQTEYKYNDRC